MRPSRLEVSGFTAFREPVEVDFEGADLFALTGPTGSGKSSLIDAIVFALYGSVPRIGQREVAPIVSLGKLEARVRFEFWLDGVLYTVARVVRRTRTGATTAEARLERAGDVLAGTADEVTGAVERLLGLAFDHFTKSVVLPQGQFAAFLQDRPADRQKLLRELLDLAVYERMRDLAKQRRAAAEAEVQLLAGQLDELAFATPEAEEAVEEDLRRLEQLRDELEAAEPELRSLRADVERLAQAAESAGTSMTRLERVLIPAGTEALAASLTGAREAVTETATAVDRARLALDQARKALADLPAGGELDRIIDVHRRLSKERAALGEAEGAAEASGVQASADGEALESARRNLEAARHALDELNRLHAAHALAATLVVGEPCPVCRQPVGDLPPREAPAALAGAEKSVRAARAAEREAETAAGESRRRMATDQARVEDLTGRVAGLEKELTGAPNLEEAQSTRAAVGLAEAARDDAERAARQAAAAAEEARKRLDELEGRVAQARRDFDQIRDAIADLGPPVPERLDLAEDWTQLSAWAAESAEKLGVTAGEAEESAASLRSELSGREAALAALLKDAGLQVGETPPRDVAVAALAAAENRLAHLREAAVRARSLRESVSERAGSAELAKALGRHLSATGFEAWLLEEALAALVVGANELLDDLSDGAYSLAGKRDFVVIDHRNADESRSVRTLSGGETFLVSLALALALAEQLASMSVHGGGRLESIFLDEGFGTLDAETLDTVAHVIQELGAQGRTVGIVTHVRELADQVPTRFEVRKGAGTATVERVDS